MSRANYTPPSGDRNIRFITVMRGDLRSRAIRVRVKRSDEEVFIEQEGIGEFTHLSLHRSGEWSLRLRPVSGGSQATPHSWRRPSAYTNGLTPALWVGIPSGLISYEDPLPSEEGVANAVVRIPPHEERLSVIQLFIAPAGIDNVQATTELGTQWLFSLALGPRGDQCIFAFSRQEMPSLPLNLTAEQMAEVRSRLLDGPVGITLLGDATDGSPALLLSRVEQPC